MLFLFAPVLAAFDALDAGRLGVLHLLRARLLMRGADRAASRQALKRLAYERLVSARAARVALPLLAALALALAFVLRAASPPLLVSAFAAVVLALILSGAVRVLRLPGAHAVVYTSDSVRRNATNGKDVALRLVSLLQMIGLALTPFSAEIRDAAQSTGAFAAMLRDHVFPALDVALLAMPGDAALHWLGLGASFAIVGAWLAVLFATLRQHDVAEQREALYRRTRLLAAFELLSSDALVFTTSKLLSVVHCVRDGGGAWQLANEAGACFTLGHTATAAAALLALLLYAPTAVLYGSSILVRSEGRFSDPASDVAFSPAFSVVEKLLKLLLAGVATFGSGVEEGTLTLATALLSSAALLAFLWRAGERTCACAAVRALVLFENAVLAVVAGSGLLARWAFASDSSRAGTVLLAGWGALLLALVLRLALLRRGRGRRSATAGGAGDGSTLVFGGKEAKQAYYATAKVPRHVAGALWAETVVQTVCGGKFTLARTASGEVWSLGEGGLANALGHGGAEQKVVAEKVAALKGHVVVRMAAGQGHAAAVTADGALFTFGYGGIDCDTLNVDGQLGHGDGENQLSPTRVAAENWEGRCVVSVACGNRHTAAVLDDGSLFTFGRGDSGQLGHGDEETQLAPKRVAAAKWEGRCVVSVACGRYHTAVALDDGSLYTFGDGEYGRLGHGDEQKQLAPKRVVADDWEGRCVVSVACGTDHTAVVLDDGSLYTVGHGGDGRLGHGDEVTQLVLKRVAAANWEGRLALSVACGMCHTAVVLDDRSLFTFGRGGDGRLGHGDEEKQLVPKRVAAEDWEGRCVVSVACGIKHTAVVLDDESLYTFGNGGSGRLGHGDEEKQLVSKRVAAGDWEGRCVVSVACSDRHTAVVLDDGSLYTFGDGDNGQLGHGDEQNQLAPERVVVEDWEGRCVVSVACGSGHTAVVLDDGSLYTFGYGGEGQLGHGDEQDQLAPERVVAEDWEGWLVMSIACGEDHTAVVLDNGSLYTFGQGGFGQLGHGDEQDQLAPECVVAEDWEGRLVMSVACGQFHTAVVLDDGSLYTFGYGGDGLLGHGDTQNRCAPTRVALPCSVQSEPPAVVGTAFSETLSAAWTADGRVFVWGKADVHGELAGAGAAAVPATGAAPGKKHAPAVAAAAVAAAGADSSMLLPREVAGLPVRAAHRRCRDRGDHVIAVTLGRDHSAYARTARGCVFAWGRGIGGQLGLGATDRDHDAPRLMGPVQGRFVSGVFVAHDATVWVAFGSAADAEAGRDDEQPAGRDNAGGIVATVTVRVGASDGVGGTAGV
jgi:alpha-tubulin suppressor-like RCC1 family protein